MLSTIADSTAEPKSSSRRGQQVVAADGVGEPARRGWSMTPVLTRAPTMTNRPAKNTRVGHSTSSRYSPRLELRRSATSTPAPSRATTDGSRCSTGAATKATMTRASTTQALDEQAPVADGLALVERHHPRGALRVVARTTSRNSHRHNRTEHATQDDDQRRQVDQEVVEGQPGPAGDDDVGRVADQGGGAADVGGQHLGDQERDRRHAEPLAHQQGDRRDQQHGGDVVQQRRGDRGDQRPA